MAVFCYTWDDADVYWNTVELTWAEFCIIKKITGAGFSGTLMKQKLKRLTDDEKRILIELFVRVKTQDIEFEKRMNKHKNTHAKVKIKDIEMFLKEAKNIDIRIFIDKKDNEL